MKLHTAFDHDIIPVPIRDDLIVHIQGIPWDMTPAEAAKIVAVIQALGQSSEPKLPPGVVYAALSLRDPPDKDQSI